MFLKQLEIIGFKSFAEKISLEFVPGVTAVVGPNGSGKSNIIDAIRWVLGEQSAKSLRGGKMEDIIFAGSDTRKPLNYAEVQLTLNNEDNTLPIEYNEVCVARRVYRSGESEYLLNGQNCRLKDIIDLFMDSGLGKEAFSIISQGKVEEVLNSKPEERRIIFEEAAGVLKYKTRKKKAEAKLEETTENLNRVKDILHELEGQIGPLQVQASIAKDYLQKKKELETHEVALMVHEIGDLHEKWQNSKAEMEKLQLAKDSFSKSIDENESLLTNKRTELATLDEEISVMQSNLLAATKELEKLQGRLELQKERKNNAAMNSEQLKKNIHDTNLKIEQLQKNIDATKKEIALKEKEVKSLQSLLTERNRQIKGLDGSIEETIESLKSDYIDVLNEQASAKNELKYLQQQLEQQITKSNRLHDENKKFIEQRNELATQLESKLKEMEKVEAEINDQLLKYDETEKKVVALKQQRDEKEGLLRKAYQFIQKTESRVETLEEMEEDYSGFYQGVKEILKAKNSELSGIEGAIAELIQVPRDCATAIEIALGAATQHIVVREEKDARKAIGFLKSRQLGRATFLPLDVMKERSLQPSQQMAIDSHPAYIGTAMELVNFKEDYRKAISNLLGNIVIARDLSGANELAKLLQHRVRIVTLDGDVVNPGGSMTGGALRQKSISLLGRKTELEDLKVKLNDMKSKTGALEKETEGIKQQLLLEEQSLESIRERGQELRLQQNAIQADLAQIEMNKKNIDDRLSLYDFETNELKTEKENISERMSALKKVTDQCEKKIETLNRRIEELTEQRNSERRSKESLEKEISELSSKLAVAKEQLSTIKKNLTNLLTEMEEFQSQKETLEENLKWLQGEMSGHQTNEKDLVKLAEEQKQNKVLIEKTLAEKREARYKLQIVIEQKDATLKETQRQYNGITNALTSEEVKSNRLEVELDNLLQRLREDYSLSYEGAKNDYPLILSAEETRKKVKLIKLEISELGSVNLGAIEEYERVNERYQFLNEQEMDLQEAKSHLFEVINEMDSEMIRRFSITFEDIQREFSNVFVALFGGGRAELKLTDPDDLLHTGVDIVAQPPGKKLQNLNLLSGGERSLTAIALLFSIIKIRPVPFCILDEVEAALDEANVQRFSHYLRAFSDDTQFIVITHRQGTMEGADVLYGVTMQESGVSKIVSVKLENMKEYV